MDRRYTIPNRPTEYAGVMFRSQLEAHWAAFFDVAGIEWEYEPVRMRGWVPDFRLWGKFLAEVKPIEMDGFSLTVDEYEWVAKALRGAPALIFGSKPTFCLAAMAQADADTVGARTVFYDPSHPYRMRSVSGDGGSDPCRNNTDLLWREAFARLRNDNRRAMRR